MITSYVDNPAWVGQAIADTLKTLESTVRPEWLPSLDSVRRGRRGSIISTVKEYGCGAYGCVLPTLDPGVVMKLTTDDTEAEFASELASDLVAPICVTYHMVVQTKLRHQKRTIYLLWRDSAEHVGEVGEVLGTEAVTLINNQHIAAQKAYLGVKRHADNANRLLTLWAESCEAIARQTAVPELRELGDGLVEVWGQQNILFGDIHQGNVGLVNGRWVITDPGNIAVVDRSAFKSARNSEWWEMSDSGLKLVSRPRSNPSQPGERDVVGIVISAARKVATGPGRRQAYISEVWAQLKRDGNDAGISYDQFKCELIDIYQASRITLVPAKDKRTTLAKGSAISIRDYTVHMVEVPGSPTPAPTRHTPPRETSVSDDEFADTVNQIASDMPADMRFGGSKIFISDIWDVASADPVFEEMGIDTFKRRLFEVFRKQLITMSRADFVQAMDTRKVAASELRVDGASFNFVSDPRFNERSAAAAKLPAAKLPDSTIDDANLTTVVNDAVRRMPPGGRFMNGDKVFISEIWKTISRDPRIHQIGMSGFKKWLIKANRNMWVALARADLVGAMDQRQVEDSEIIDMGAQFHFVVDKGYRHY